MTTRKVTVKMFLDSVEFVRKESSSGSIAEAFLRLADDADEHKFKVAVPRAFAKQAADYLADFDDSESGESPTIELTFEIPESKS